MTAEQRTQQVISESEETRAHLATFVDRLESVAVRLDEVAERMEQIASERIAERDRGSGA